MIDGDDGGFTCSCKSKTWYWSRVTWIERFLFRVGYFKDADMAETRMVEMPLAGRPDKMKAALDSATTSNDASTSGG